MAGVLRPDELKNKEAARKAVQEKAAEEKKSAPAGMPAFLNPPAQEVTVAEPKELAASPPPTPVVVVPVEKEEVR